MRMQLACVPPERVAEFWPIARPYVYAAMDRGGLRNARDVEFDVLSGHALLWLAIDGQDVQGAGVTQLIEGSCWIVAWGAEDQKRCAPLLSTVENYARAEGCYAVRLAGRKGWERMLDGYRQTAVVLEKELT